MLSKKELLTCRKCKVNKGEMITNKCAIASKFVSRLYLHCNECNSRRRRKYQKENRNGVRNIANKYITNNKEKKRAWNMVARELKSEKIVKPEKCHECNEIKLLHGHHKDYSKPLDVKWLCANCHKHEHKHTKGQ